MSYTVDCVTNTGRDLQHKAPSHKYDESRTSKEDTKRLDRIVHGCEADS